MILLEVVANGARCRVVMTPSQVVFLFGLLAGVGCQPYEITELRLMDGPPHAPNSGRVEVLHVSTGNWLNVCDVDYWGNNDGTVACRQLGFPGLSQTRRDSYYGEGSNNGSVGGIGCSGDEYSIGQCPHQPVQQSTGCNGRVAGLICTVPGFLGCFADNRNNRVFPEMRYTANNMTIGLCLDRCRRQGACYAGLENRRDCYCGAEGTRIDIYGRMRDQDCQAACMGNPDEVCGNGGRLSVYDLTLGYCTDPGIPANGGRVPAMDEAFHFGVNVSFFCNDGFELMGAAAARCVLGDTPQEVRWDQPVPQCRALSVSTTPGLGLGTPSGGRGTAAGTIVGIVVACVLVVVLVAILVILVIRKRRRKPDKNSNKPPGNQANAYTESDPSNRYQTTPGTPSASSEYQDLTLPSNNAEGPYTSLRKPAQHRPSEKEIPEYLELYADDVMPPNVSQGGKPPKLALASATVAGKRAGAGKRPGAAGRQKASRTDKSRLPSPEVIDNEYSYVDASRFSGAPQGIGGGKPQDARPQPKGFADGGSVYYSVPPDARGEP